VADATWELDLSLKGAESYEAARQRATTLAESHRKLTEQVQVTQKVLTALKQAGLKSSEQYEALNKKQKAFKKEMGLNVLSATQMKGGLGKLFKSQKELGQATRESHKFIGDLSSGMRMAGGPFASLHQHCGSLTMSLGKAGVAGAAIIALAAVIALDYGMAKSAVSLARYAVTAADAYRSERLELEGLTHAYRFMWGMALRPGSATQLQADINAVSQNVAIGRDKVLQYSREIYQMGLRGATASYALKAMAEAGSAAGEGQAQLVKNMALFALYSGQSGAQMYAKVHARFGKIVEQQMLSLDVQSRKLKENLNALFRGLKIDPLLKGMHEVLSVFDQGTVTFNAWRGILGRMFDSLFSNAPKAGSTVKIFLQEITLYALKAEGAFIKMGGFRKYFKNLGDGGSVLAGLAQAAAALATGMLMSVSAALKLVKAFQYLGATYQSINYLNKSVDEAKSPKQLISAYKSSYQFMKDKFKEVDDPKSFVNTGLSAINGMIEGIHQATPALVAAAKDAAQQADKAAKDAIQAHSPSRRAMVTGRDWTLGYALGIRANAPAVRAAAVMTARVPQVQAAQVGRPTANVSRSMSFGDMHFPQAAQNAPGTVTIPLHALQNQIGIILENVAIQAGAF